ncbi:MAG: DUF2849 domain-containing protein [Alcaligenaceae bacterium]|nr:DUF2849 domain-containing protein [Alcaligenaceae bacterium]
MSHSPEWTLFSANRLHDGVVVWLGSNQDWVEDLESATLFNEQTIEQARLLAQKSDRENFVTGIQELPAEYQDNIPVPSDYKERIRSKGPSVRPDLGKQAGDKGNGNPYYDPTLQPRQANRQAGIYQYDEEEHEFLKDRAAFFGQQVQRRLKGELSEDEFKTYRLMNGLYLQLHAYMLRIAIPYGTLSAEQLKQLAYVARTYDKGYGHFTTRQNLQFHWPRLDQAAEILSKLADVDLHAIQTSGNCIRNTTTDQFAGAAFDEDIDPRVYAEILRQWSTDHPEFTYLPRKFKIAITGSPNDRAAIRFHDIGIQVLKNEAGEIGFAIYAGGGLGRTPIVATKVRDWLPQHELLKYVEAILRVYNALGRRDNLYKARIKILVRELKPENFIKMIEDEFTALPDDRPLIHDELVAQFDARFVKPVFESLPDSTPSYEEALANDKAFARWVKQNTHPHKQAGYISAVISLKPAGGITGDITADEMDLVASLAEHYSMNEVRITHEQNMVLPHVKKADLYTVWKRLREAKLASDNIGLITDMISCPGMDYCSLANARSIPVSQRIALMVEKKNVEHDIGKVTLNISGCINACAHHHVANIGILGVDKNGEEFYQITLGGSADENAVVGKILGSSVTYEDVPLVIEAIIDIYLRERSAEDETFIQTYHRIGAAPFKEALNVASK